MIVTATAFLAFASPVMAQNAAVTISVDANQNQSPISPNVYGVALGNPYYYGTGTPPNTTAELEDLNVPLNRYGGNEGSTYNWQLNADNRGNDNFFESIADNSAVAGERADTFTSQTQAAGAQPLITVPMMDWIGKLGPNRSTLASFSVAKYGAQTAVDQFDTDAGNGVLAATNQNITGNDPNDASTPNNTAIQNSWVQHIVSKFGTAAKGGVKYYILDNEYSLWYQVHRDVMPTGQTMAQILQRMISYSAAIKSADSSAMVFGPEEYGWYGYFFSGYDQQYSAANNSATPDRDANQGMDYIPFLLNGLHQNDMATGQHSIDVLSLHYYPGSGVYSNDVSAATELLRNRNTRSLWDTSYTDPEGFYDPDAKTNTGIVMLIPRMKKWVATYYPGLKTALTEYNWGAEGDINGATAQADVYGILGREGLDFATRFTTPDPSTPTYKAMKMYRNYDGQKSTFGDTSVMASVPQPDDLSAFAALRSTDGAMTVMVINKIAGTTPVTINLANFTPQAAAQAWQLTAANAITQLPNINVSGSSVAMTVPGQSITLVVLPKAAATTGGGGTTTTTGGGSGGGGGAFDWWLLLPFVLGALGRRKIGKARTAANAH
jgi:hypothetical protein